MQYRKDKYGNELSILGFGCMRLSKRGSGIDLDKAQAEIQAAIEAGINYFDTAYMYAGNEQALGEVLRRLNARNKIYIATKLPQYMVRKPGDFERFFNEELRRLQTDHVDYYLMHMLTDYRSWQRLVDLGIEDWLHKKQQAGQIRQVGFSFHGTSDMFIKIVDCYDWDFCQIQYNYMDEHTQAGLSGLRHAAQKGLPVIIMEPLRGGKLATSLPQQALDAIHAYDETLTPAALSFRWLWNQPEVTCVLSGMNSLEMLEENIRIAENASIGGFSQGEFDLVQEVIAAINAHTKVGCTACQYCMPCPQGVKIPQIFAAYNKRYSDGFFAGFKDYFISTSLSKEGGKASQCIGCGLCEKKCPQGIEIRKELAGARRTLEIPGYPLLQSVARTFMKY